HARAPACVELIEGALEAESPAAAVVAVDEGCVTRPAGAPDSGVVPREADRRTVDIVAVAGGELLAATEQVQLLELEAERIGAPRARQRQAGVGRPDVFG